MNIEEVVNKFIERPERMSMGAGKLSKRYKCSKEDIFQARNIARNHLSKGKLHPKFPKILIFDIETSPLMAYIWQTQVWKASVSHDKIMSEWFMITWSAKWLFDDKVMSAALTPKEVKHEDDSRIIKELWNLLDEADIVIAHNGSKFDVPNMNARFIVHNMKPTSPYQTIDTVMVARKQFGFTHNNLDALARIFGFDPKLKTDFDLWKKCLEGDQGSLTKMREYNEQDVLLLEEVYLKLRPWIKSHPNVAIYLEQDHPVCPNCGGEDLKPKGYYYTPSGRYKTHQCQDCGGVARERTTDYPKELRNSLFISVAR